MTADARDLRINGEMLDSVDEELELEIDDDRLTQLLADSSEHPQAEMLDREPVVLPPRVHNPKYHRSPISKEMYVPAVY
jgi:hypothetical protein